MGWDYYIKTYVEVCLKNSNKVTVFESNRRGYLDDFDENEKTFDQALKEAMDSHSVNKEIYKDGEWKIDYKASYQLWLIRNEIELEDVSLIRKIVEAYQC